MTDDQTRKVAELLKGERFAFLTGRATVVDDLAKKRELWNSAVEAWSSSESRPRKGQAVTARSRLSAAGAPAWTGIRAVSAATDPGRDAAHRSAGSGRANR